MLFLAAAAFFAVAGRSGAAFAFAVASTVVAMNLRLAQWNYGSCFPLPGAHKATWMPHAHASGRRFDPVDCSIPAPCAALPAMRPKLPGLVDLMYCVNCSDIRHYAAI